ncbi:MAG: polysaccharide deacetylase family protein [Pseudomonadota bacterium]
MSVNWAPLTEELNVWRREKRKIPIWWRDDDAVDVTLQLDRLRTLARRLGIPIHLAIIPAGATETLAKTVGSLPELIPVVHGWAHKNHSPGDQKKAEFGSHRPDTNLAKDTARSLRRLGELFGADLHPCFVPPWNRICDTAVANLAEQGYRALSTYGPRKSVFPAPGLEQINTHIDPIDWRNTRSLVDQDKLIEQLVRTLADRRLGQADHREPLGLLTHHLVHDEPIWDFTQAVLSRLLDGPVELWQMPRPSQKKATK